MPCQGFKVRGKRRKKCPFESGQRPISFMYLALANQMPQDCLYECRHDSQGGRESDMDSKVSKVKG